MHFCVFSFACVNNALLMVCGGSLFNFVLAAALSHGGKCVLQIVKKIKIIP